MLVDDSRHDNFFHGRVIEKVNAAKLVVTMGSGSAALEYIKSHPGESAAHPDLIFLDINMPGMNGWQFLDEYDRLGGDPQRSMVVIMLTTTDNTEDREKAMALRNVSEFITKPLTNSDLENICNKYF